MSEKTGLREDLRSEIETLAASDAPDEEVLNEAVRRIHEARPLWDWSGIYLLVGDTLVLGPRTAPADHSRIEVGDGVCGTAVAEDRNQVVEDVREVENYLACSIHTRSELVVLIKDAGETVGEFDIDSDTVGAFSAEDEALLEEMGALISGRVASLAGASRPAPRCRRTLGRGHLHDRQSVLPYFLAPRAAHPSRGYVLQWGISTKGA
jgi:L-methionine (R)-S-oxide reductase